MKCMWPTEDDVLCSFAAGWGVPCPRTGALS
jgi:hypothetical protein